MASRVTMDKKIEQLQNLVMNQMAEKADAIVWLQGNMYDRGPKVLELFKMKYAPRIVVTGNNTRVVEEDDVHVDDIVRWLNEHGVSREEIMVDDQAMNTKDQAEHVIAMAVKYVWRRILLVGSTHHQLRAFLTFLKQAQQQGWDGRIINQTAKRGWDERVSGRNQTVHEAFDEEMKKTYTYRDLASVEEGINYFR